MELSLQEYRIYILAAVALILLISTAWYAWRWYQKNRHHRHVHAVIAALGVPTIRDVVLPDGLDGLVFIDYLLLAPGGIVVLDIHYVKGYVFGGASVDQWSQVHNRRTYKFSNPLYAIEGKCQAVAWNVENFRKQLRDESAQWHTYGWVVFSNDGSFPKGIPPQVSMIDDLAGRLAPLLASAPADSEPAGGDSARTAGAPLNHNIWDALHNLSINTRAELGREQKRVASGAD